MLEDRVVPYWASRVPVDEECRVLEDYLPEIDKEVNCTGTGEIFRLPGTLNPLVKLWPDHRQECRRRRHGPGQVETPHLDRVAGNAPHELPR
jgi:hypothetical protein